MFVFLLASLFGRGKRFLLEGILIFYYGPKAVELIKNYSNSFIIGFVGIAVIALITMITMRLKKKKPIRELS